MKIKSLNKKILRTVCLGSCLPLAIANAAPQFTVTDLGSLNGSYSIGLGVNNNGLVSGLSYPAGNISEHAVLGEASVAPIDLEALGGIYSQAYSVNSLGDVVGSATLVGESAYHAFKAEAGNKPLKDLKGLLDTSNSLAFSINNSGQATGFSSTADGSEHAVIWQADGATLTDLGTINLLNAGSSHGVAINSVGEVAGFSSLAGNKSTHAVLWSANGSKKDLGTLGGSHSAAYGINDAGEVIGSASTLLDAEQHAFLWQANQVPTMKDLGALDGAFSEARDISNTGDIVGHSFKRTSPSSTVLNQKATLWQSGTAIDLNTLKDPTSGVGWTLLEAQAISDDGNYITGIGKLVGNGIVNGERHAFLLKKLSTDTTPPVISVSLTPTAPNVSGWYQTPVSVLWSVTDAESAISAKTGCVDSIVSDSAGQVLSCGATSAGGTAPVVSTAQLKVDTVAPTLVGISSAMTQAATSTAGTAVTYTVPTGTDALSGVSTAVSCLPASGATFAMGLTAVNCAVSDNAGNTASASFSVTVADQGAPTFSNVPVNFTQAATNATGAIVTYTKPVAADNISVLTAADVSCLPASGATFAIGATPVNCSVKDSAGNPASASFTVNVADQGAPTFSNVPANFTQAATSLTGAVVTYIKPLAADNISVLTAADVSCLPASGATFAIGATPVNCSVKDSAGNTASAGFIVSVADQGAPTFSNVPANVSQAATSASGALVTYIKPIATDNISILSPADVSCLPVSGATFVIGATPVNCSVKDSAGNTASAGFIVSVADQGAPTFSNVPANVTQAATSASGALVTYIKPVAVDNISVLTAADVSCLPASGTTFAMGATTVNCLVKDVAGNSNSTSFVVTVADQTLPTFSNVPANFSQAATSATGAVVTYTKPLAADTISGISAAGISCLPASGATFAIGATPVNCSVKDTAGNTASASFTVTVADQGAPTFSNVPANVSQAATSASGALVTYTNPLAADNISVLTAADVSCLPASGANFAVGATTVNCLVKDVAGNTNSTSFVVTVADLTLPTFSNVTANVSQAATSASGAVVTYTKPVAVDSISGISAAGVSCLPASGATFAIGATTVNCSVKDVAGNSNSASFVVTVTNQTPPIVKPPVNETISITKMQCQKMGTAGDWVIEGKSTKSINNKIQLYSTNTVPVDLTKNVLKLSDPVTKGMWKANIKAGQACTLPLISLRSTAMGTVLNNIKVGIK